MSITHPLHFEPFLRPMVWGGRRLGELLGKTLPTSEAYGESWELSDHPMHRSVVAEGPFSGKTLKQLMETDSASLLGGAASANKIFPWLVKFLDANDWLSVQVHPDEEAVKRLWPGEGSKTEAWFILDAAPGSRIYAGLLPGTDQKQLRSTLQAGTVAECLHSFTPKPGDSVFLPAGTVHAVGGGVLIAEIQQTSDATFRLFDWNRRDAQGKSRQLHVEESIASIHWDRGPVLPIRAFANLRQSLVRCKYFNLDYEKGSKPFSCEGKGRLQVLMVLQGEGKLGAQDIKLGQTWLLPAALSEAICEPHGGMAVLLATLP